MTTTTDQTTMNPEVIALGDPNLSFSFAERASASRTLSPYS